jgi:hypothetical protein
MCHAEFPGDGDRWLVDETFCGTAVLDDTGRNVMGRLETEIGENGWKIRVCVMEA